MEGQFVHLVLLFMLKILMIIIEHPQQRFWAFSVSGLGTITGAMGHVFPF
jgi:hypothetical protein